MNIALVIYIWGTLLKVESAFLLLPVTVALIYGEDNWWIYLLCAGASLLIGFIFSFKKPSKTVFYEREGMIAVSGSWILLSLISAVPLTLSGDIPNYLNAVFESVSGFTTTGASILSDVESLTHAGLFWRSFTHLIGGMGILVFMLSLTPAISGSSIHLMRAESPGPSVEKMTPKLQTTALCLYGIYFGLAFILFILYLCGGVSVFDSILLSMGTAGTGGFGIKNDSLASYSSYVQIVTGIFMLLFSINFNVYFLILCGKTKQALKSEELHFFLAIVFSAVILITFIILPNYSGFGTALKDSFFQVSTLVSSTGYSSCDYDVWPLAAKAILLLLMFMGACAGSTGGGFKVSRIVILFKAIKQEFFSFFHPRGVQVPNYEGKPLQNHILHGTLVYLALYVGLFLTSLLLLTFDSLDFESAFTAVLACINNIGPGLNKVGPACNYCGLSVFSKIVLIFDMLAGRLELYPIIIMFLPKTWMKKA